MRRHTTFRTGNPTLTASTFKDITNNTSERMTLEGSVNKSGISLLILMFTAFYTFSTNNPNYI